MSASRQHRSWNYLQYMKKRDDKLYEQSKQQDTLKRKQNLHEQVCSSRYQMWESNRSSQQKKIHMILNICMI